MSKKIVISHRGACGYLPEHSMEAKAMAHAMNADFIEQDVVMTKDDYLVVLHDHFLDGVTNVASVFPQRARTDGRFYVIDFTLEEIQSLHMTEAFKTPDKAIFPERFPLWQCGFQVHTLDQEIELIQGLNKSRGKNIGIYPEIKAPAFHRFEGKDISMALLSVLKKYGYHSKSHAIFLQCFDAQELQRIKNELFSQFDMQLKLVQLIAETAWGETCHYEKGEVINYDYDWMFKSGAMQKVSSYADAIGPWFPRIVDPKSTTDNLIFTELVNEAHQHNLAVHPFTFRRDKGEIPSYANDFETFLDIFYIKADVDGVFTDFPDLAVAFLNK
ncbi:glycerophosphodiester phosphodiesterase [Psychromonas sp. Urea-02u-13]|uniref:glycerophosphodiester phosphodiesterase n=1 Tax=Psychromonas sp. Urea-02u-13 TaxID=2058326 RepID=UPI000C349CBD|nr:glycerophosphodiester phosphodiesterase [Psychromonas sp. Urea-02u-13]PKG39433.1 glycerophosphodiester phosphodiesterase [Psychromonas sp. Urea-02u-13]